MSLPERKALIQAEGTLSVARQCDLLTVSRSTYYYAPRAASEGTLAVMRAIDEIHTNRPFLGSRRVVDELADDGWHVNRKRVQRLMRDMEITALYPKPKTSRPGVGAEHTVYPYLLTNVAIERPNQVWAADVTYLPMAAGFAYLVAIMDVFSRKIMSWRVSNTADARFCVDALHEALTTYGPPEVFNSDQGSQFTSRAFTSILEGRGVRISMDGRGRWIDNVFIERFWRSLKYEEVYLHAYETVHHAKTAIGRYMAYYNHARRHASLKKHTPEQAYNSNRATRPIPPTVHPSGTVTHAATA